MAVHASHAALPFPVKNARYSLLVVYLDADGDPLDPTTPDTEISKDNGAFADCAEEVSVASGSRGVGLLTLSGAETDCSCLALWAGVASGPKATLLTLSPRVLPVLESGTAQAGGASSITLAAGAAAYSLVGCIVKTTGGTGGGGTGGANNQARVITAYNVSTKEATVAPAWETNPSSDTTYEILLTDLAGNAAVTRALRPTTDGRTLDVTTTGAAGLDWGNVENASTTVGLSGTTIKAVTDGVTLAAAAVQAIWDALSAALTTADSIGKRLVDFITGDTFGRLGAPAGASVSADVAAVKVDTAAIKAKTDNLPSDPADQSLVIAATDALAALIGTPAGADLSADVAAVQATADAIEADTQNLQSRTPAALVGGRTDASVGAYAAGQSPADLVLVTPANKLATNAAGAVALQSGVKKNTALAKFEFLMVDATDRLTPETGLTVDAERSIDGGAFAACANTPATEVGNGIYWIDLAASDLNGNVITLRFTAAGAATRLITLVTDP